MPSHPRQPPTAATPSIPSPAFVHLVTLAEAVERTGLTAGRIDHQVRRGKLGAYRVGDLVVLRLDEVEDLAGARSASLPERDPGLPAA